MKSERTHFVYEAYDADGICLYVGCTGRPTARYRSHMTGDGDGRGWFDPFVTHWRVSGPYPKEVALRIEAGRIAERQPIWNGMSLANRLGKRRLIADYLRYHGVRFEDHPRRNRPVLVPVATKRRKRRLRVVDGGAA